MPPKKKAPNNAFYYYMEHFKREQEKRGNRISMKDAADMAGPSWKNLPAAEKEVYKQMAAKNKAVAADDLSNKFTSLGVSFREVQQEKDEREERFQLMVNYINNTINELDFTTHFRFKKFYLCHVNYFYKNDDDVFKPAEIALSEFSLKTGLINTLHRFVDSGAPETGFRYIAKSQSERSHRIPIDGLGGQGENSPCQGERDYFRLYSDIVNFLTDNQKNPLPPIYTMPDDPNSMFSLRAVVSTMNTLCEAAGEEPDQFRVYELPFLFHAIRYKCIDVSYYKAESDKRLLTVPMALNELTSDTFSYERRMACDFHEENDVPMYCSLSIVKRWVYHVCSWVIHFIPDNKVPGKHEPERPGCRPVSSVLSEPVPLRPVSTKHEGIASSSAGLSTSAGPSTSKPVAKPSYVPNGRACGSSQPLDEDHPDYGFSGSLSQPAESSGFQQSASSQDDSNWPSIERGEMLNRGRGFGRLPANRPATQANWALVAGRGKRMMK